MRILTHNYLKSIVKGAKEGYPLAINATGVEEEETDVDPSFLSGVLPKLEWSAVVAAVAEISSLFDPPLPELPADCPPKEEIEADEELAAGLHRVLVDVHVTEGNLVIDGIPNMVLHEDEV